MYYHGKKVVDIDIINNLVSRADCDICGDSPTLKVKITYDEHWDDTEVIFICTDCLIMDGWFIDEEEIKLKYGIVDEYYF